MSEIETFIAIDLGTSGSGCSYCTKEVQSIDGISIWTNWGDKELNYKNPSAILYKEDEPQCWGILAVKNYKRLRKLEGRKEGGDKYYLVQDFKLNIHSREDIVIREKIFDVEKVVSDFLRLIRIDIEEELQKQNKILDRRYVKYALTVPAIWSDSDKALMRRAAKFAGILLDEFDDSDHFLLALEPESAALPCLLYKSVTIQPGTRFLVFDAGGGTVDLSVYETTEGTNSEQFRLRQLIKASGGTCGGNSINGGFMAYIQKVLGQEIYAEMLKQPAAQILEQNLEQFKIGYTLETVEDDDEFFIPVPISLARFLEKFALNEDVFDVDEGEIVIPGEYLKSIYMSTIDKAMEYIFKITRFVKDLDYIFMVGGFSACNLLYNAVRNKFENEKTKIIKPSQPGIRVLQGAIWFAKNPHIIVSRVSPLTYGVNVTDKYNQNLHDRKENLVNIDGKMYSQNLFKVMIKAGTRVKIGVRAIKTDFATFEVYSSTNEDPVYVTGDDSVAKLITVTIPLNRLNQRFDVFMIFGETELKFEILDSETKEKIIHTEIHEFNKSEEKEKEKTGSLKKKKRKRKKKKHHHHNEEEMEKVDDPPPIPSRRNKRPPGRQMSIPSSSALERKRPLKKITPPPPVVMKMNQPPKRPSAGGRQPPPGSRNQPPPGSRNQPPPGSRNQPLPPPGMIKRVRPPPPGKNVKKKIIRRGDSMGNSLGSINDLYDQN